MYHTNDKFVTKSQFEKYKVQKSEIILYPSFDAQIYVFVTFDLINFQNLNIGFLK